MDIDKACKEITARGYAVLKGLLDPDDAVQLDREARRLMDPGAGYVNLEGALNELPDLAPLCTHPAIIELSTHFLDTPFYLANNVCMKWVQPGAADGEMHSDWPLGMVKEPYPPWPMLLQTMWMLTEFSGENGATCVVPQSHLWGKPPPSSEPDQREVAVVGQSGDLFVWHGALWHRSGANTTKDHHRMGANIAYIPQYLHRPPSGWPNISRARYERFPADLQQILERSVAN